MRVVIYKEGDHYVATVLEHYLVASAKKLLDVYYEMEKVIATHIKHARSLGKTPFENVPPAPKGAFQLWENSKPRNRDNMSSWLPKSVSLSFRVFLGDPASQDPVL